MSSYSDDKFLFGTFCAKGTAKDGSPLGDFVLEAIQLNPDGSGWIIVQINNDWLLRGDSLETNLRGQFGKVTVDTTFSLTVQCDYRTQLIGFGGITENDFNEAVRKHIKKIWP